MATIHQSNGVLRATLSGECDFSQSRELHRKCKLQLAEDNITRIEILMKKVTSVHTCLIGTMMILSDWVKGNFHIRFENCTPNVKFLFESELLPTHFIFNKSPPALQPACSACLEAGCQKASQKCHDFESNYLNE